MLLGRFHIPQDPVTANGSGAGTQIIAAPVGAGFGSIILIRKGSLHNRAAVENVVSLREGAGGNIVFTANLAADGGGSLFDFGDGWPLPANTALVADIGGASCDVNVTDWGYTSVNVF